MSQSAAAVVKAPCATASLLKEGEPRRHFAEQAKPVDAVPTPLPTWNMHCRDDGGGVGLARGWHVTIGAATGTRGAQRTVRHLVDSEKNYNAVGARCSSVLK